MTAYTIDSVADRYILVWVNFWLAFYCISALTLQTHGGDAALVLLFTSLLLWWKSGTVHGDLSRRECLFIYAVWLFLIISLLGALFQPEGLEFESVRRKLSAFDGPSRWLLLLPLFYLFSRLEMSWRQLSIGLSIAILIATWMAIDQVYQQGVGRAYGAIGNPIPFGELLVVADLFTWVLMIHAWNRGEKWLGLLLLIASLAAFYAAMLTGTRGALLAYGIMVLVTVVQLYRQKGKGVRQFFSKVVIFRLLGFVVIFGLVSQTDQYQVVKAKSLQDIQRLEAGAAQGFGGGRGYMAKLALEGAYRYPLGGGPITIRL